MHHATARELIAALAARRVSAVELLDRAVARIERYDGGLNAVVVRDFERARRDAADADTALARGERLPLLGLPITVKESHNVAGLPTTWGLPGTEGNRPSQDAVAVARLKAAGAVVLGKTNVPPMLSDYQSYNPIYGVTNNPWDLSRSPGGSSGGAAAALAAGYVSLELGSDIAGSLRVPAHCCGVFAHKPTYDLVPMRGHAPPGTPLLSVTPPFDLAVLGPMARSAGDLALALEVVAGPDDDRAVAYRLALPPPRHGELKRFRVLVLERHPLVPTGHAVRAALAGFADRLAGAGCSVGRASPELPDLALMASTYSHLLFSLVSVDVPDEVYRSWQAAAAALPDDDTSVSAANMRARVSSHRDWIRADRIRTYIAHQWRQLFRDWDVVVCPVMPLPALPHDHTEMDERRIVIDGTELPYFTQGIWANLATLTGLPATAMPIGRSEEGLPIGIQAIGPLLEDRTTLAFAELAEREFGGFVAPPGFEA